MSMMPPAATLVRTSQPPARRPARAWLLLCLLGAFWQGPVHAAEPAIVIPPPAMDEPAPAPGSQTVVLAGGCFWGVQAVFQHVKGVSHALSGYAGGTKDTAIYEVVSSGRTGHAESVQVTFDPRQVSFGEILQIYFSVAHDPTQLNRQGSDTGTQYRSAIFFPERRAEARRRSLYRSARQGRRIPTTDRDAAQSARGIFCRRVLPPGLRDTAPDQSLHRL